MDVRNRSNNTESGFLAVPGEKKDWLGKVLALTLIVAALTLTGVYLNKALGASAADSAIKHKQYQAVFLTNGQVYFGKVSRIDSSYVKLTNIYYLQVQQAVQPKDSKADPNAQPQVSLAKLGSELHAPEDVMYISRQQILFWENIKDDGKVVKAIKDYSAQNK